MTDDELTFTESDLLAALEAAMRGADDGDRKSVV